MSPEPTQEPTKEGLTLPNITTDLRMGNDSESEDEDISLAGYMPLSQIPIDSDPMLEEVESENTNAEVLTSHNVLSQEYSPETLEVWTSTSNYSNIDLDADKIDQVKTAMASFTLPTTAIPEWANSISEERWKEQLITRIQEMQNRRK